jgi:hypothetical protein
VLLDQLYVIGAAIVAALATLWAVFQRGKSAQRDKDRADDIEAVEKAKEVAREVDADPDPVDSLRDRWLRK